METSRDALAGIEQYVPSLGRKVYVAILAAAAKGLTRKELETTTGILTQTLCGRLNELEKKNRITKLYVDGKLVKREGCSVYVAVLAGPYLD